MIYDSEGKYTIVGTAWLANPRKIVMSFYSRHLTTLTRSVEGCKRESGVWERL